MTKWGRLGPCAPPPDCCFSWQKLNASIIVMIGKTGLIDWLGNFDGLSILSWLMPTKVRVKRIQSLCASINPVYLLFVWKIVYLLYAFWSSSLVESSLYTNYWYTAYFRSCKQSAHIFLHTHPSTLAPPHRNGTQGRKFLIPSYIVNSYVKLSLGLISNYMNYYHHLLLLSQSFYHLICFWLAGFPGKTSQLVRLN